MAVLLTESDVVDLVDITEAIRITEAMYQRNADGATRHHTPIRVRIPAGSLRITTGALLGDAIMGARVGSASGLRGDSTVTLLFDSTSGDLLCLMAYPFSLYRTGANMALAVRWLTGGGPARIGLIGTGRNALGLLTGIAAVRPITALRVHSRRPESRARFAARAAGHLGLTDVADVPTGDDAVSGADIVVCSTNADGPVFDADALAPDAFVGSMGSPAELSERTLTTAAGVYVGARAQEQQYHHYHAYREDVPERTLIRLIDAGRLAWGDTVHELADVVRGAAAPVRSGLTVYKESQGGYGDIALAAAAYHRASALGRGHQVDLTVRTDLVPTA
jgi:ornithine cyclodeaminase/alanine dehydrogenase-like protein (mu-crystallin family)